MNKMTVTIPIAAISDGKQIFALGTLFTNLLLTAKSDTFYELNAILAPDVSPGNIERLKKLEKEYSGKCRINVVKMDNRFDNIPNDTDHIANACAYKLCLGEVLPQYEKIIYLDSDIIVFQDLQEMFSIDLEDNYIAGVFSPGHYLYRRDLINKLGIPDLNQYVNAGILIFNLKKIRQDKLEKKLCSFIGQFNDSIDQHIFNKVCYDKIKLIPFKYNVNQTYLPLFKSDDIEAFITKKEASEIINNPVIFHYTGNQKPWQYCNLRYSFQWHQYFRQSPFADNFYIYRDLYPRPKHDWIMTYPEPAYQPRPYGWILQVYYDLRGFLRPKTRWQQIKNLFCKHN